MDEEYTTSDKSAISRFCNTISQTYQLMLDKWTPYKVSRWLFALSLLILFALRILLLQGFYIIAYGLGIFHLNLFISFLTPKIDPAMDFDADENGPRLPLNANEEFRPFIRRLPEFKFWQSLVVSTLMGLFFTCFEWFNIPVFWPILVMYFFILFFLTMKRQIMHMIKYKYLPFTHGKPQYQEFQRTSKNF